MICPASSPRGPVHEQGKPTRAADRAWHTPNGVPQVVPSLTCCLGEGGGDVGDGAA